MGRVRSEAIVHAGMHNMGLNRTYLLAASHVGGLWLRRKSVAAGLTAFLLAMAVRLAACWLCRGDEPVVDVATFGRWAEHLEAGRNPYTASHWPANYPPLWLYLCWLCLGLSQAAGVSFATALKLLVSSFDAATAPAVVAVAGRLGASSGRAWLAGLLYAINPVAVLVASFQGQNDPVVLSMTLWACWLLLARPRRWCPELAAVLMGLSLTIKPIGVLFLPLLVAAVRGPLWRRAGQAALWLAPSLLAWMPYVWVHPQVVAEAACSYRGPPDFGWVGIYNAWQNLGHASSGTPIIQRLGWHHRAAFALVYLALWWLLRRRGLIEQLMGVVLGLYLIYGTLGAQYLFWIIPLASAAGSRRLLPVTVLTAIALVAFFQLHHHAILTGRPGHILQTGVTIPQWGAIFFLAQALLYVQWARWMFELLRSCQPAA